MTQAKDTQPGPLGLVKETTRIFRGSFLSFVSLAAVFTVPYALFVTFGGLVIRGGRVGTIGVAIFLGTFSLLRLS